MTEQVYHEKYYYSISCFLNNQQLQISYQWCHVMFHIPLIEGVMWLSSFEENRMESVNIKCMLYMRKNPHPQVGYL